MSLIERAKEHFGTTENPDAAGYVLPDGSMLDFKRDIRKLVGHGFIKRVFKEDLPLGVAQFRFMKETGAIRVSKGLWIKVEGFGKGSLRDLGFYWEGVATIKPTEAQARVIGKVCSHVEGLCSWNLNNPDGSNYRFEKGFGTWPGYMRAFNEAMGDK